MPCLYRVLGCCALTPAYPHFSLIKFVLRKLENPVIRSMSLLRSFGCGRLRADRESGHRVVPIPAGTSTVKDLSQASNAISTRRSVVQTCLVCTIDALLVELVVVPILVVKVLCTCLQGWMLS